jgi:catechol 2,3-dioxygenase-like lactoylglutathione lyase family enzyme
MITGTHAIIYADNAEETRASFRDVLEFRNVDTHDGWLIFKLPPAELGIHPTSSPGLAEGRHEVFLMCGDIHATVAERAGKGVELTTPVGGSWVRTGHDTSSPRRWELGLYEPKHPTGYDL